MFAELFETEMKVEIRAMQGALADEEVASGDVARESLEPSGVTGVGDLFPAEVYAVALRVGFGLMLSREGSDLRRARRQCLARMDLFVLDREGPLAIIEVMAECVPERAHPGFDLGRADDLKGVVASIGVERGIEEGGDSAEVVAVKMRDQDRVDFVARKAELSHPGIGRPATVEEHAAPFATGEHSGLSAASGPERVTRSDENYFAHRALPLACVTGFVLLSAEPTQE